MSYFKYMFSKLRETHRKYFQKKEWNKKLGIQDKNQR